MSQLQTRNYLNITIRETRSEKGKYEGEIERMSHRFDGKKRPMEINFVHGATPPEVLRKAAKELEDEPEGM